MLSSLSQNSKILGFCLVLVFIVQSCHSDNPLESPGIPLDSTQILHQGDVFYYKSYYNPDGQPAQLFESDSFYLADTSLTFGSRSHIFEFKYLTLTRESIYYSYDSIGNFSLWDGSDWDLYEVSSGKKHRQGIKVEFLDTTVVNTEEWVDGSEKIKVGDKTINCLVIKRIIRTGKLAGSDSLITFTNETQYYSPQLRVRLKSIIDYWQIDPISKGEMNKDHSVFDITGIRFTR